MKNLSLAFNIVLSIALAVLYYLHFNTNKSNTENKKDAKPKATSMPKIKLKSTPLVYVNADSLWENFVLVKQMRKELEAEKKRFESKFEADYHKLENDYLALREKAESLSQEEGMKMQQDLMAREQKLTEYRQNESERLAKLEADKTEKIQKAITEYLTAQYSKSNYAYILGYSAGGGILFANDSLEITNEVVDGLNATLRK
ncbi:MAG TPA: OmpH family outer membrane protein [Bacteroidia bacterium]|nr:OmpH family outer membrane protein [Bacteroidia bacterium]